MTIKEIKKLIELGEGYHLEFKESIEKTLIEEVCAFANSSGGKIILGVTDKGKIKGINTDNSTRSRIQDMLKQLEPFLVVKISIKENMIILDVPKGNEKPYGCSKGFFVRIGPNSQKLSRNEIISFFEKEGRIRFDELENRKADFNNDFDENAYNRFIKMAGITPSIDTNYLLKNLDCLTADQKLTNAGVLFFTKSTEFLLLQATVVCVLYKGNEKLRILDKKDFDSNLIENIENAILFVQRHTNLEYKIEHLQREEIPEIPEVALRESIINAVCHRDYFQKGANVMVEIFDNRVEISNPGGIPSELDPKDFGKKSVARNPVIASLLHRIDYIERIGTGINRIKNAVKKHGKCTVDFKLTGFFSVVYKRMPENQAPNGGLSGGLSGGLNGGLNEALEQIIKEIRANPGIQAKNLAEILNRPINTLEKQIKQLIEKGFIKRRGSRKTGGYWLLNSAQNMTLEE